MPAPGASQIESPASGFLKGAGLQGEDIPGLAAAIANTTGQALTMFLSQAMVMPGLPVAADPITGSGASAGPRAGQVLAGELARALERLLVRFGALVFEPWLERTCDLGVCAVVRADGIEQRAPHTLLTTERGGFLGISQAPPPLSAAQRAQLTRVVEAAGRALRDAGYLGPYNIDAFLYRDRHSGIALRPLCEINARISFGWVAAALAERHGFSELGFGAPPPDASKPATLLVAPEQPDDPRGDGAAWAR